MKIMTLEISKIRKGLALCFVTPVINQAKTREVDTRRREWIKMLNQAPEYDALVWIGITKGQRLFGDKFKHFGLLLAVKEVR